MTRFINTMIVLLVLSITTFSDASPWQIDPDHSSFQFKVRHLMVSNVKGDFTKASGVVIIDDKDISNLKVELTIDAASVSTDNVKRDDHLRGRTFLMCQNTRLSHSFQQR